MLNELQILSLLSLPKIGRKTIFKLVESIPDAEVQGGISDENLFKVISEKWNGISEPVFIEAKHKAAELIAKSAESKISIFGFWNSDFPKALKTINDPPLILHVAGQIQSLNAPRSVAIIGTRDATKFGLQIGERLSEILAREGFTIVSGLAKGCDTAGHIGCLKALGRTVAFLAHGLDRIYPNENRDLAFSIIRHGGALATEYPLGTRPFSTNFIERDRLQAGLSEAVIVIETDIQGGTMHTVRYAETNKKLLACIAHPEKFQLNNPKSNGNQFLIKEGRAFPIHGTNDIETFVKMIYEKIGYTKSPTISSPTLFSPSVFEIDETQQEERPKKKRKKAVKGESKQIPMVWE